MYEIYHRYLTAAQNEDKQGVTFKKFKDSLMPEVLEPSEWSKRPGVLEVPLSSSIEFLKRFYGFDVEGKIRPEDIYEEYSAWCRKEGKRASSPLSFSRDIGEAFGKSVPIDGVRVYRCGRKETIEPQVMTL